MPLMTEPSGVNAMGDEEWVGIDVAVDSGATETVMSEETLHGVIDITGGPHVHGEQSAKLRTECEFRASGKEVCRSR